MILDKTKRRIFLIVWIVLFAVLLIFGPISFGKELKSASKSLFLQKNALSIFEMRVNNFEDFQENYPKYEPTINKIDEGFINPEAPIDFIEFLEEEAARANLALDINPSNVSTIEDRFWDSSGYLVMLGGDFPMVNQFINRIENSSWFIEIIQLNVERVDEENDNSRSQAEIFKGLDTGEVRATILLKAFSSEMPKTEN